MRVAGVEKNNSIKTALNQESRFCRYLIVDSTL